MLLLAVWQALLLCTIAVSTVRAGARENDDSTMYNVGKMYSLPLDRAYMIAPENSNDHPEIRHVRTANRIARKFRRSGVGRDIEAVAIQNAVRSLERRGIDATLQPRQAPRIDIVVSSDGLTPTTTEKFAPAVTPKTPHSLGISQDGSDFSYFSVVQFGAKKIPFKLAIDSGSSDIWIYSSSCTSSVCEKRKTFGKANSSSLMVTEKSFDIQYGIGEIIGVIGEDRVQLADLAVRAEFGLATVVSDDFSAFPIDGILGLGSTQISKQNVPTVLEEMVRSGLIERRLFAVALSRADDGLNDGVLNFGGVDPTLYKGNLTFTDSLIGTGLWELPLGGVGVDGKIREFPDRTAVIDTGASLILVPFQDALTLHLLIPGAETNGEHFSVPCGTTSKIHFTFSNVTYSIPPKDYVGGAIPGRGDLCITLIAGVQVFGKSTWLVGDVFLKNVYSVFDVDNTRVGFAAKRQPMSKPDTVAPTGTTVVQSMTPISKYASSIGATTRNLQSRTMTANTSPTAVASNTAAADAGSSNGDGRFNAVRSRSVLWSWTGALLLGWMLI